MMPMPKQLPAWMDALWLGLLAVYVLAGAAMVPFHGDESTQIYMGRDYYYLFLEGDLSKILYDSGKSGDAEQHLRLLNGTISKTISGWIAASSQIPLDELNEQWDWKADYAYNRDTHRIPDDSLLRMGRLASAWQLALAILAFFCFVRMTIGRPAAWLASGLFALHPSILLNGRRVMMEGSHLLGMTLILLAAAWLLRNRRWRAYLALGCATGFAVAAKHPNALVAALAFFACFSYLPVAAWRARQGIGRVFGGFLLAGLLALLVFYALNPSWWLAPVQTAETVYWMRTELLQQQVEKYGGYASVMERADGFFRHVFGGEVYYFEVPDWVDYDVIHVQIAAYQGSGLAGVSFGGWLFLLLAALGSLHFIGDRRIAFQYRWLLLVWGLGIMILTFLLTPLSWGRYYLPALPFAICMAAYGLWTLAARIRSFIKAQGYGFAVLD